MKKIAGVAILLVVAIAIIAYYTRVSPSYTIRGTYVFVGNPCFTSICPPGMVYAIDTENMGLVYLTREEFGEYGNLLWTNEPGITVGTQVSALGEVWYREDTGGRTITLLEYTLVEVM